MKSVNIRVGIKEMGKQGKTYTKDNKMGTWGIKEWENKVK